MGKVQLVDEHGRRICVRCRKRNIWGCQGMQLARDTVAAWEGRISWEQVREHCGRCAEWLLSLPDAQDRRDYFMSLSFPPGDPNEVKLAFPYPRVLTAQDTLRRALDGASIARFGDGELRLAADNGTAVTQPQNIDLRRELQALLHGPTKSLVCIPKQGVGPKADRWANYGRDKFVRLMKQEYYGSAFVSRPDSEPVSDDDHYWGLMRQLWKNRDVVLVVGTDYGSLNEKMLRDARNLRMVYGLPKNAYCEINRLEDEIGKPPASAPVILCLGATATVLAERLAKKGVWALDLGHVGKFMPQQYR